jgi:methanogenic corrinoid protein MtbC1
MNAVDPSQRVDRFRDLALSGNVEAAVRFALDLLDAGTPETTIITDVIAVTQRMIGESWLKNELSVADEHLATGVAESTLYALSSATPAASGASSVVVACAEGDWHSIGAHMIAEMFRVEGIDVSYLGASTPADALAQFLRRHRPDALVLSCSLPLFFGGVTRLADAAHASGTPVLAGGRALHGAPERARLLGADGYAENVAEGVRILATWHEFPPAIRVEPTGLLPGAALLESFAEELADCAYAKLRARLAAMASYSHRQLERTREDLAYIVRFLAAARLVDEQTVFIEFLDWLGELLQARGVPRSALVAGLEVLQFAMQEHDLAEDPILTTGLEHLAKAALAHE